MPSITRHPWIINRQWQYRKVSQFRVQFNSINRVCLIPLHNMCTLRTQNARICVFHIQLYFDLRAVKNKLRGKFKKIVRFMAFSPWSPAGTFSSTELIQDIVAGYRMVYDTTRCVKPFGRYRANTVQNASFTLVTVPFGPVTLIVRSWKFDSFCPLRFGVERCMTRQNRLTRSGVTALNVNHDRQKPRFYKVSSTLNKPPMAI